MASGRFLNNIAFAGLILFLNSCSGPSQEAEKYYFSGACRVSIKVEPAQAKIHVDGIHVGYGLSNIEIPCGEKQIMIKKAGYLPVYEYKVVTKDEPLNLEYTLEDVKKAVPRKRFALSDEIVEQIEAGLPITAPGEDAQNLAEGEFPSYMGNMGALFASLKENDSAGADGGMVLETGPWTSVEDWR